MSEQIVYIAPQGFEVELAAELAYLGIATLQQRGRLFLCDFASDQFSKTGKKPRHPVWAQNIWFSPEFIPIKSIGSAVQELKGRQRNWALFSTAFFRRAALIEQQLPKISNKPFVFGQPLPTAPLGAFTLWEENLLLAAKECSNPFKNGELSFAENKIDPPGRAYLKLWELFTLTGKQPAGGELCLDLGSSPGGWTWVLANLGARVFSLDKAPLAPNVAAMPNVDFCGGSAFALGPEDAGTVDWLCSDVICYPEKLFNLIERWVEAGGARNYACTIKFQGEVDFALLDRFLAIEGSRLVHLAHNKHELTWFLLSP